MDKGFIKELIIKKFPGLYNDTKFAITSPIDPNYNCIAWAFQLLKDRWMEPPGGIPFGLDGITWWPADVEKGMNIRCLIEAFSSVGYVECDSWEHEEGYIKAALYYNPENHKWTHAARESRTGNYWMSKLGPSHDIQHGSPYTIENNDYGKVYCIMKKEDL